MSWNPRRFAAAINFPFIHLEGGDPLLLWLTDDAISRITSGVTAEAIDCTVPMPAAPVVVGLASPIETELGDVSMLVGRVDEPWHFVAIDARREVDPQPFVLDSGKTFLHTVLANITTGMLADNHVVSAFTRGGVGVGEVLLDAKSGEPIFQSPPPDGWVCNPLPAMPRFKGVLSAAFHGSEARMLGDLHRAAWTLLSNREEREVTATVVYRDLVEVGKERRKSRAYDVSVIDVRPPSGVRYSPSGRVVEHDHRWTVRGHWRNQPWGPGRSQRRRIWIDAHVAGPEDKPLIDRPKVQVIR